MAWPFARTVKFAMRQGTLQAKSLTAAPGMEFGLKAHNLGILAQAREFAKMVVPGVALTQTDKASTADKTSVIPEAAAWLGERCKRPFGAESGLPLLLAVRSSPQKSSPGMGKTVIYLGMNEATVGALAKATSPNTAFRTYAWFLRNYARDVRLQNASADITWQKPARISWEEYTGNLLHEIFRAGLRIPDDPREQLMEACDAVWGGMSAAGMSGGILIQEAVVIDDDPSSGVGVYFTRSPKDGDPTGCGRVSYGSGGSEVVMGDMGVELMVGSPAADRLGRFRHAIEKLFGDAIDIEFAFTRGALHMLQARPIVFGDPGVQVRVWQDLARERLMPPSEYPKRVYDLQSRPPANVQVVSDTAARGTPVGKGKGVCGSYAETGSLTTDNASGDILFTNDPNDPAVIKAVWEKSVAGVVTTGGHEYSHIAIMARAMQIPMLIGFEGDVGPHIGRYVLLDESTGALYLADTTTGSPLTRAPTIDTDRYLSVDLGKIQSEVLEKIVGMSVAAIANWHDMEIERSVRATKEGDFASALTHTWRAHYIHVELDKLNNRRKPFVVYVWENRALPDEVTAAIGEDLSSVGPLGIHRGLSPEAQSEVRALIAKKPGMVDPIFAELSRYYAERLRVEVTFDSHPGQYDLHHFIRVSAVVEGGDPYMYRKETFTRSYGLLEGWIRKLFGWEIPKELQLARAEARTIVEKTPGARYVEYDFVNKFHDRGVLDGRKVIAVLPPNVM